MKVYVTMVLSIAWPSDGFFSLLVYLRPENAPFLAILLSSLSRTDNLLLPILVVTTLQTLKPIKR